MVIGGCGHVGLPLGVKLSLAGAETTLLDLDEKAVETVTSGRFPFLDKGGDRQLEQALSRGMVATSDASVCQGADVYVFVTGTPVDEHLNPRVSDVVRIFERYRNLFRAGSLVIIRSTLFPGTTELLSRRLKEWGLDVRLAFCPERVAQGFALEEIDSLPQLIGAFDDESFTAAYKVFRSLSPSVIRLSPLETEFAKLMTNSWRYLEFAIANQFYAMAESHGLDFYRVFDAVRHDYPRATTYRSAGFAAGPCLFKDTMQLAAFVDHSFFLGHAAMLANEGLANVAADKAQRALDGDLGGRTIGLLGMTFKADNDDIRDSLSYKVRKILQFRGAKVLCHDPYRPDSSPLDLVLRESEVLVLGAPHAEYHDLDFTVPIVDVWGLHITRSVNVYPGMAGKQGGDEPIPRGSKTGDR